MIVTSKFSVESLLLFSQKSQMFKREFRDHPGQCFHFYKGTETQKNQNAMESDVVRTEVVVVVVLNILKLQVK